MRRRFNAATYNELVQLAGEWADGSHPWRKNLLADGSVPVPASRNAIYVICRRDGDVSYVGSVSRAVRGAAVCRVGDHLRSSSRVRTWASVWFVPLKPDTPMTEVRRIEGRIGRYLLPSDNRRLPRSG
jgi:hypothetical protein